MILHYKKGDSRLCLPDLEFVPPTKPALCIVHGNKTRHIPLILPDGVCYSYDEGIKFSYSSAIPAIHVIYNGRHYIVPNRETDNHSIPKGTYVGRSAYDIFRNFIGKNRYRVLKNSVTIVHRGVTKTFGAGTAVWLTYAYAGKTVNLTFTHNKSYMSESEPGYDNSKEWWLEHAWSCPTIQLHNGFDDAWSTFPFLLKNGINFY